MQKFRATLWRWRVVWITMLGIVVGLAIGWVGGRGSIDQKFSENDINASYAEGDQAGRSSAEITAKSATHKAHENGYWEGWEEGLEEGEEEGRREGAQLATPERLDFQTRYMVTYEPSGDGPVLRGYLEMPLGTLWECENLDGCTELIP